MKQLLPLIFLLPAILVLQPAVSQAIKSHTGQLNIPDTGTWNRQLQSNSQQILFMENKGQVADSKGKTKPDILFSAGSSGSKVFIASNALYYQFTQLQYPKGFDMKKLADLKDIQKRQQLQKQVTRSTHRFTVKLLGANPQPLIRKEGQSTYTENYYLAHCPKGITGVYGYEKIIFKNVYEGIDWVVYSKNGLMEYDFLVHAGADAARIKLKIEDADGYAITATGDLQIKTMLGKITEKAPVSYDEQGRAIATQFIKNVDGTIGFSVKAVANQTLRIDPAIAWATYYGGVSDDYGNSCAMDTSGNIYLAGTTSSTANISSGGFKNTLGGSFDAFLVKFNAAGSRLWATYYGGASEDYGSACTIDDSSNVYLAGYTYSSTGISSGGFQNKFGGTLDAFLVKFTPAGSRAWATYYGGVNEEQSTSCSVDSIGNVYLAGYTGSTTGIASGGFQNVFGGGYYDAFLVKFTPVGKRVWATYYGGAGDDLGSSCTVDHSGNIFFTGYTSSTTGIASGGFQTTFGGGAYNDAFLVKFNAAGSRVWGTYYGGQGDDYASSCAVDTAGNIFVAGYTNSAAGIASGGFKNTIAAGGYYDAFLVKFNAAGSRKWATYYGDAGIDYGNSCAVDGSGNIYLAGNTTSAKGIASGGFQNTYAGGTDAFIAKFTSTGSRVWASYYGGTGSDYGNGFVVKGTDSGYLCGYTTSTTSIASGGFKNTFGGGNDAFLAKTSSKCVPFVNIAVTPATSICQGTKTTFTATPANGGATPSYQWKKNSVNVGTKSVTYVDSTLKNNDTIWTVMTGNAGCATTPTATSNKITMSVAPRGVASVTIAANPAGAICQGTKVTFTATPVNGGTAPAYQWKKNSTNVGSNLNVYGDSLLKNNDTMWVTMTSNATCLSSTKATSAKLKITVNALPAKPAITTNRSTQLCLFDSVTLSTAATGSWQWQRNNKDIVGAVKSSYAARVAGAYKLRLTSAAGCVKLSDSVAVTVINNVKPVIQLINDTLVSSSATGNQWFYNLNSIGGATNSAYKPFDMGYYSVQVTQSGCKSPMSDLFIYTANTLMAKDGRFGASIQPNPAGSYTVLNIIRNQGGMAQATLMDVEGRKLWVSGKIAGSQIRIPVSNLAQGTYMVLVQNGGQGIMVKLLVQR